MSNDLSHCIDLCLACFRACNETINGHCLEHGGDHLRPAHVRTMVDCAEICRTSADFMMRRSANHAAVCDVCAEICTACAEECERFDDEPMRACAEACRRCAASCLEMAGAAAG